VSVTIERGGQKQDITLNIAQVAAQATKDLNTDSNPAAAGSPKAGANYVDGTNAAPGAAPGDATPAPASPPDSEKSNE
jgi:hypothetical protein